MKSQHIVAYADDRDEDRMLFKVAFERAELTNPLVLLDGGPQVQSYLQGLQEFADRTRYPLPHILFLDYKMPEIDGIQLIRWIRARPECKGLIIILFSGSAHQEDIDAGYAAGANAYITKPSGLFRLSTVLQTTHAFWVSIATPPASIGAQQ